MNKKIFLLLFFLGCNTLLSEDKLFHINVNKDYYNPLACSFEWQFSYSEKLSDSQYLNLHFDIYEHENNKLLNSFDSKIIQGKNIGRFHLFISVKPSGVELDFNSPDSGSSYKSNFDGVFFASQRIKTKKNIEITINKKVLLVSMEPIPQRTFNMPEEYFKDVSMLFTEKTENHEIVSFYDIYITPELKIQEKCQQQPETLEPDKTVYEKLSKTELANKLKEVLKKRQEIGELYKQNKASLEELNRVQTEINIIERILHP